ncbi:MAG: TonB-dependent receptor, partial [Catalinimonas sp.]
MRILFLLVAGLSTVATAQSLTGTVAGDDPPVALAGAGLRWLETTRGTVTDTNGRFELLPPDVWPASLVVSYVGYRTDTLRLTSTQTGLRIHLRTDDLLDEVVVRSPASALDRRAAQQTELITASELTKAACCNLAESFETNASVDVALTDAVSGARQVRMLGLDGAYVQLQTENVRYVLGLAAAWGLTYTPGPWVASIDVGKGAGSVMNGYESMTGQLNVELLKPQSAAPFAFNAYANQMGRNEMNLQLGNQVSERISTLLLLHGDMTPLRMDPNGDGFV